MCFLPLQQDFYSKPAMRPPQNCSQIYAYDDDDDGAAAGGGGGIVIITVKWLAAEIILLIILIIFDVYKALQRQQSLDAAESHRTSRAPRTA